MTEKQIRAKFPATVKITKYSINKAERMSIIRCLGARTVKKVLGNKIEVYWGVDDGNIYYENNLMLPITTKENVNFMQLKEPCTVTLVLV